MNPIITELVKKNPNQWKAYIQGNPSIFEQGENETLAIARLLVKLQGKQVRTWNGSFYLSVFCWLSVVVIPWLLMMGYLGMNFLTWGFWIFFILLAIASTAYSSMK